MTVCAIISSQLQFYRHLVLRWEELMGPFHLTVERISAIRLTIRTTRILLAGISTKVVPVIAITSQQLPHMTFIVQQTFLFLWWSCLECHLWVLWSSFSSSTQFQELQNCAVITHPAAGRCWSQHSGNWKTPIKYYLFQWLFGRDLNMLFGRRISLTYEVC